MNKVIFFVLFIVFSVSAFSQFRSFNDIFPDTDQEIRASVFSESGYVKSSRRTSGFIILGSGSSRLDPSIVTNVLNSNPGYFAESIMVLPGNPGSISLLDIYNALGNISALGGRLYNSHSKGRPVPLFENATRIVSERNTNTVRDPAPASSLPQSETVFIRLNDNNFGNTFYRGEMSLIQNGLRYTMTNFRSMSYLFVPVIREGKFVAQLYFEPIQEGVLIYSAAGADISDFFASRIHVDSAISKRLAVITGWSADGIRQNR